MVLEPGADTHAGQALGHELQLAALAAGMVHLHQGAVLRQALGIEVAGVFGRGVDEEQCQGMMLGLAHQLQGFGPGFLIDDDRQYLCREERTIVDRDDVDRVRQVLSGQGEAGAGRLAIVVCGIVMVLCVGLLGRVIGEFLLVAHWGTCTVEYAS